MARNELTSILSNIIDERLHAALAPHVAELNRISNVLGIRRGPGRPPKALSLWSGGKAAPRRPAKKGDARKFSAGQSVRYRQGRGEFVAKVLKVDASANTVTVQRESDGKKVVRPAGKIYA